MKSARSRRSSGFTIIEVLIVLVVSVGLLVASGIMVSGRQHATAFNQAVNSVQTQVQQVINEVGSGYYASNGTLKCEEVSSNMVFTIDTSKNHQGGNLDCLFLGKVIQFGSREAGEADQFMNIYTIAGLSSKLSGSKVDLATTQARVLARAGSEPASPIDDMYERKPQKHGLTVSEKYYESLPTSPVYEKGAAVGLITNLGSLDAGDGTQLTNIALMRDTEVNATSRDGAEQINDALGGSPVVDPENGARVCFNSGGNEESALLTIGGAGRPNSVDVQRFRVRDCGV